MDVLMTKWLKSLSKLAQRWMRLGKNVMVKNVGNKNVSCANGSTLDIKGSIILRIQISLSEKLALLKEMY